MCVCVRLTFVGDQHGDDEAIDGDDTCHDNRNDRLHDQVWSHDTHGCYPHSTLGRAIGCSQGWERESITGL